MSLSRSPDRGPDGKHQRIQSRVALLPTDGIAIVILMNKDHADTVHTLLARETIDRLLGLPTVDWIGEALGTRSARRTAIDATETRKDVGRKPGTGPSHVLSEYEGDYENSGYGLLRVCVQGDHLEATYNAMTVPLSHWHYDVWNGGTSTDGDHRLEDMKFLFQTDQRGNVAAVDVPFEPRVRDIVFTRKPATRFLDPAFLTRFEGDYELEDKRAVRIDLAGSRLELRLAGESPFHLMPAPGGEFIIKEDPMTTVVFREDDGNPITELEFREPGGTFIARRKP